MSPIPPPPPGFSPVESIPPPPPGFTPVQESNWQSQVKPTTTFNGKPSVQRSDGGVWYGPEQGNTGKPGWFDGQGNRLGDAPGSPAPSSVTQDLVRPWKQAAQGVAATADAMVGQPLVGLAHKVGLISDETAASQNAGMDARRQQMEQEAKQGGMAASIPQFIGKTAPSVALMTMAPGAGATKFASTADMVPTTATFAQRAAANAIPAAATAYATTPGDANDRAIAGTAALAATPLVQAVGEKVLTPVVGKIANTVKGVMNPKAAQVIADSDAAGVSLKPSTIQAAIKEAPAEVQQAKAATDAFANKLAQDVKMTPFSGLPEVEAAAAGSGPRKAAAQAILDQVNSGGQEAKDLVQTSAGLTSLREKMRLEALANQRAELAQGVTVVPTKTLAVIDNALSEMNGVDASKWPVKDAAIAKLQAFRNALASTTKQVPTKILDESGQPLMRTVETPNSFTSLGRTRSDIGDDLSGYFKGTNAEVGEKGSHILQAVKNAISDDMSEAAQASGNPKLAAADLTFRKEYANYANTYKDPAIVSLIQSKDPSKIMEALARSGPEKAQRIYDVLDPKGQAAAAKAVFDEAIANATNKRTGDFIPGNVSGGITDKLDALGVVMKGENKFMLDGVKNTMQYLAKADPTQASALGQRITESAASAADKSGALVGLYHALKNNGTDLLFNTPAGKRFLFAAAGTPPSSPVMKDLVQNQLPKVLGVSAGREIAGRMGSSTAKAPENPNDLGTPPS